MKAKVTTVFPGRPDNEPVSRQIEEGEIIQGDLAVVAIANKWAEPDDPHADAKAKADADAKAKADADAKAKADADAKAKADADAKAN